MTAPKSFRRSVARTVGLQFVLFLSCLAATSCSMAADVLVENGRTRGYIVIPEGTDGRVLEGSGTRVLKAAHALAGYLGTMSGTHVPIRWDIDHCPGFRIYIGSTKLAPVRRKWVSQEKIGFDGFIIKSVPGGVVIAGRNDRGTANGVYHFAEEVLGIHWYTAEDSGPTIPRRATVQIPQLDMTVKPDFAWRGQYYLSITKYLPDSVNRNRDAWWTFNRLWGISVQLDNFNDIVPDSLFDEHPEYFALIDGKRTAGIVNVQRCLSNPDVLQMAIDHTRRVFERFPDTRLASLNANDGGGWCECDDCAAMGLTQSHRSLAFCNAVAEANEQLYPARGYEFFAYLGTFDPPLDVKAHRNVVPMIASMGWCRIHAIDSDCPSCVRKRAVFRGWRQVAGRFAWYSYLVGGPFNAPGVIAMAQGMRFVRDLDCIGGFREHTAGPQSNWAMLNWMEVKLQWDVDLDAVKLRRQFIEGYYGLAAADAVERIYDQVETGLHTSSIAPRPNSPYGHNYLNQAFMAPIVETCREDLDEAMRIAEKEKNPSYARRVTRDMGALLGELPPDLKGLIKE